MTGQATDTFTRLDAKRREQTPQALARLVLVTLFVGLWVTLWVARIPMPLPFLVALLVEIAFFLTYWRVVFVLPNVRAISIAQYGMLAVEVIFHTTMVYFLGGISWMGAFAYVFGLVFTNAFLDLRRGLIYTTGACAAFTALILLEATGVVPHYEYIGQGTDRYADPRFVVTTLVCATGVFYSVYLWSNWVGQQLRTERDSAIRAQDQLLDARAELERSNEELERRVRSRTVELEMANAALRDSEARLRTVITNAPIALFALDRDGVFTLLEGKAFDAMNVSADRVVGRSALDVYAEAPMVLEAIEQALNGQPSTTLAPAGEVLFEAQLEPMRDDRGNIIGVIGVATDITERKRAEHALQTSGATLRATIESTADGILVVNNKGNVVYANRLFAEMWRLPPELIAKGDDDRLLEYVLSQLLEPDAFLAKVKQLYESSEEDLDILDFTDGRAFERYSRPLVLADEVSGRVWSFRDVTERKQTERTLAEQARRDPLTNLLNRRAGLATVDERLVAAKRDGKRLAVLVLDLDKFKSINDNYSHEMGDNALIRLSEVLTQLFGERGVVCRLGGDEFEIAVEGIGLEEAVDLAEQFRAALYSSLASSAAQRLPHFTASIGIACFPEDGDSSVELGRRADEAMYAGKANGGDTIRAWRSLTRARVA